MVRVALISALAPVRPSYGSVNAVAYMAASGLVGDPNINSAAILTRKDFTMHRFFAALSLCALVTACSTAQVQTACESAATVLQAASPLLSAAPDTVKLAATALRVGTYACGTPEYAAARNVVVAWLAQRGIKAN